MLKALYYPHTEVGNPTILKNALLLWDSLETIGPVGCNERSALHRAISFGAISFAPYAGCS